MSASTGRITCGARYIKSGKERTSLLLDILNDTNNTKKRDVMRIQITGTVRVIDKDKIHIENARYAFQEIHNMLLKQKNGKRPLTKYEQFRDYRRLSRDLLEFRRSDITPESFETLSRYNACWCNFWLNEALNEISIIPDEGKEYEFFISGKLGKLNRESGSISIKVSQYITNIPPLSETPVADTFKSLVDGFIDEHLTSSNIIMLTRDDIRDKDIDALFDTLSGLPDNTVVVFKVMDINYNHYVKLVATNKDSDSISEQSKSDEKKVIPVPMPLQIAGTVDISSNGAVAIKHYTLPNHNCFSSGIIDEFLHKYSFEASFGAFIGFADDDLQCKELDKLRPYVGKFVKFAITPDAKIELYGEQSKSDKKKVRPIPIYVAGTVRILHDNNSDGGIAIDHYALPNIDCVSPDIVDEFIVKEFKPRHCVGTCLGLHEDDVQYKELDKLKPYAGKFVRFAITPDAKIELYGESFASKDKIEPETNTKGETVQLNTSDNNTTADIHIGSIKIKKNGKCILIKNATIAEFGETGVPFKGTAYSEDTENADWYTLLRNAAADYAVKKIKSMDNSLIIDYRIESTVDGTDLGMPVIRERYTTQVSVYDKNNYMAGVSVVTCSEHDDYDRDTGVTEELANLAFDLKSNFHKFPNFFRRWFNAYQKRVMEAALKDVTCPYCGKKFLTHAEQVECVQKHEAKREARRKAYEAVKYARLVRKAAEERIARERFESDVSKAISQICTDGTTEAAAKPDTGKTEKPENPESKE